MRACSGFVVREREAATSQKGPGSAARAAAASLVKFGRRPSARFLGMIDVMTVVKINAITSRRTAGTNWPTDSRPARAPSMTRRASKASNCSSRPTTARSGSWSRGGAMRPPSRPGCIRRRSATGTGPPPNGPAARRRPRSASTASCGPTRSRAVRELSPRLSDGPGPYHRAPALSHVTRLVRLGRDLAHLAASGPPGPDACARLGTCDVFDWPLSARGWPRRRRLRTTSLRAKR